MWRVLLGSCLLGLQVSSRTQCGDKLDIVFDTEGPVHSPWRNHTHCSQFVTRFAEADSLPATALVSFPGSGSSWLRYLIEAATGVFTGSTYARDQTLYDAGFLGEDSWAYDGRTLLQKTHHGSLLDSDHGEYDLSWRENNVQNRGVVLIRNPYKAILSYWNNLHTREQGGGHLQQASPDTLKTPDFNNFVSVSSERWLELISDWVLYSRESIVILYEDLKKDPIKELKKVLRYLKVEVNQARLECLEEHTEGHMKRTQQSVADPYNDQVKRTINKIIKTANNLLIKKKKVKILDYLVK